VALIASISTTLMVHLSGIDTRPSFSRSDLVAKKKATGFSNPLGSFSVPYPVFSLFPGIAVGAGGAWTLGVNRFPPVGLMVFSVGAGGGAPGVGDCAVVVVVVGDWVLDGAFEPLPPQLAIDAANPARTAAPATTRVRRAAFEFSIMTSPID
jgi:hypothetical protein